MQFTEKKLFMTTIYTETIEEKPLPNLSLKISELFFKTDYNE